MLHTYQLIMLLVFLVIFCCVQLFLVFKCIGISSNQKKVFWLLITYTIVFKTVESYLELLPEFNASLALQTTHSLVHAINTFILLTIIGVYTDGYFPRNFVITSFYYDFLTSLPFTPAAIVTKVLGDRFLPPDPGEFSGYPAGCMILLASWFSAFLTIVGVYYAFGKKLRWLFEKIPDKICLLYFLLSFGVYVLRQVMLLSSNEYALNNSTTAQFINSYIQDFSYGLLGILLVIIILLIRLTYLRTQLKRFQRLESTMLLDYYQNVSMLHGSIRSLRHDLSNHLSVPESSYRDSLLTICDRIDHQIHSQLFWQSIKTDALSSREKYEIFRYLQNILQKKKLPPEALCITETEDTLHFTIRSPKRLSLLILKHQAMFKLTNQIAKTHGGSASWTKDTNRYIFTLSQLS